MNKLILIIYLFASSICYGQVEYKVFSVGEQDTIEIPADSVSYSSGDTSLIYEMWFLNSGTVYMRFGFNEPAKEAIPHYCQMAKKYKFIPKF